mmetsp:Transcript_3269/g.9261  ORF Transcript_3269/g.9261 Transcript_3269/m.9261 type:complete len:319 (+) Transcript_3269:296-1252(+)
MRSATACCSSSAPASSKHTAALLANSIPSVLRFCTSSVEMPTLGSFFSNSACVSASTSSDNLLSKMPAASMRAPPWDRLSPILSNTEAISSKAFRASPCRCMANSVAARASRAEATPRRAPERSYSENASAQSFSESSSSPSSSWKPAAKTEANATSRGLPPSCCQSSSASLAIIRADSGPEVACRPARAVRSTDTSEALSPSSWKSSRAWSATLSPSRTSSSSVCLRSALARQWSALATLRRSPAASNNSSARRVASTARPICSTRTFSKGVAEALATCASPRSNCASASVVRSCRDSLIDTASLTVLMAALGASGS